MAISQRVSRRRSASDEGYRKAILAAMFHVQQDAGYPAAPLRVPCKERRSVHDFWFYDAGFEEILIPGQDNVCSSRHGCTYDRAVADISYTISTRIVILLHRAWLSLLC